MINWGEKESGRLELFDQKTKRREMLSFPPRQSEVQPASRSLECKSHKIIFPRICLNLKLLIMKFNVTQGTQNRAIQPRIQPCKLSIVQYN